jgi:CTP synthase (UTP-ammonia lyase)
VPEGHPSPVPGSPRSVAEGRARHTAQRRIPPGAKRRGEQAYRQKEVLEKFSCNYGLNPLFQDKFFLRRLRSTGEDLGGETRIVELSDHPFYVATLFVPQIISVPDRSHPLIVSYLRAALDFRISNGNSRVKA